MTRVTDFQQSRRLLTVLNENRTVLNKLANDISSGYEVYTPGDSNNAGSIAQFQSSLQKAEGYRNRITTVKSQLNLQESVLVQAGDILLRAKEVAAQAANETNSNVNRAQLAEEIFQLRDHMLSLANTQYQGRYIYGGIDDDDPPFDAVAPYTNPSSGDASLRYQYDNTTTEPGNAQNRTVNITENLTITVTTRGDTIFNNAIQGLERLGRALAGYETNPASGTPDGTGNAFTFPDDYSTQTQAIKDAMNLLDTAREGDIMPERVDVAGRLRRIETAESLIDLTKTSSQEALDRYQATDVFEAASKLTQAQTALQASLTVNTQVLQLSILDYI